MAQKNETAIIDELYALYEQPLCFEAYKILHDQHLSEDAVQEAFLRLIRNRDKIREPSSRQVRAYVYKTLKSAALDIYRAQKRQRALCCTLDEAIDCADGESELSDLSAEITDAVVDRTPGESADSCESIYREYLGDGQWRIAFLIDADIAEGDLVLANDMGEIYVKIQ